MRMPIKGETLYALNIGSRSRVREQELTQVTVTKVGRKYFECEGGGLPSYRKNQFHIDGWRQVTEMTPDTCLYEAPEHWSDKKEREHLFRELKKEFSAYRTNMSLAQLRAVYDIINKSKEKEGR